MHSTRLRKVGGSVMLAVPPKILDLIKLEVGSVVDVYVEEGRLVVAGKRRPRYSLQQLLDQCDPHHRRARLDREWLDPTPVGRELP